MLAGLDDGRWKNQTLHSTSDQREDMDVEKLIGLVQSKPPLWNQAHPDHQNRFVVAKLWDDIATEMNTDRKLKY